MSLVSRLGGVTVVAVVVAASAPAADAGIRDRMAERKEELRERIEQRVADIRGDVGQESPSPSDDSNNQDDTSSSSGSDDDQRRDEVRPCRCSVRLNYGRPQLQFRDGVLTFFPKVDVRVSSRGDHRAPGWKAILNYSGNSSYSSDDVAVPNGAAFSGSQDIFTGSCGTHFDFEGISLPPVTLTGLVRSLVGFDQEVEGTVRMDATLNACGLSDSESRQFGFDLGAFGDTDVSRSWRRAR